VKGISSFDAANIERNRCRCVLIYGKLANSVLTHCCSIAKRDQLHAYRRELFRRECVEDDLGEISGDFFIPVAGCDDGDWILARSRTALRRGCIYLTREDSIPCVCTHTYSLVYLSRDLEGCARERAKFPARAFRERLFRKLNRWGTRGLVRASAIIRERGLLRTRSGAWRDKCVAFHPSYRYLFDKDILNRSEQIYFQCKFESLSE